MKSQGMHFLKMDIASQHNEHVDSIVTSKQFFICYKFPQTTKNPHREPQVTCKLQFVYKCIIFLNLIFPQTKEFHKVCSV